MSILLSHRTETSHYDRYNNTRETDFEKLVFVSSIGREVLLRVRCEKTSKRPRNVCFLIPWRVLKLASQHLKKRTRFSSGAVLCCIQGRYNLRHMACGNRRIKCCDWFTLADLETLFSRVFIIIIFYHQASNDTLTINALMWYIVVQTYLYNCT